MIFTFGNSYAKFKPNTLNGDGKRVWWCNHCQKFKLPGDFHKSSKPCGIRSWCKECVSETGKAYYAKKMLLLQRAKARR